MTTLRFSLHAFCLLAPLCVPLLAAEKDTVTKTDFGTAEDQPVLLYTLTNSHGMSVSVTNYGATVVKLMAPDKGGKMDDVVLGFDNLDGYLGEKGGPYFGATIGRYGNRIAKGRFTLEGKACQLPTNDNNINMLHGGVKGFDKHVWKAEIVSTKPPTVLFSRTSPDGEEGFPGTMKALVRLTLTEDNEMKFTYTATTDKPTIVNLTHHSYFNLGGASSGRTILDNLLTIPADGFTPVDDTLIPTGEIKSVEGTVMDFRKPTAIGDRIQQVGGKPVGYDHNYVVKGKGLRVVATVEDPKSGRVMKVSSDQPGVQFYSGNFLDGTITGKGGTVYQQYDALCLEPQHFPNSPNEPKFPSTELKPGDTYHSTIIYAFSVAK